MSHMLQPAGYTVHITSYSIPDDRHLFTSHTVTTKEEVHAVLDFLELCREYTTDDNIRIGALVGRISDEIVSFGKKILDKHSSYLLNPSFLPKTYNDYVEIMDSWAYELLGDYPSTVYFENAHVTYSPVDVVVDSVDFPEPNLQKEFPEVFI